VSELGPRPVNEVGCVVFVGDETVFRFGDVIISGLAGCNE
jgi:hypothetical protein